MVRFKKLSLSVIVFFAFTVGLYLLNEPFFLDSILFLVPIATVIAICFYFTQAETLPLYAASFLLIVSDLFIKSNIFGESSPLYLLVGGNYKSYSTEFIPHTVSLILLSIFTAGIFLTLSRKKIFSEKWEKIKDRITINSVLTFLANNWVYFFSFLLCVFLTVIAYLKFYSFSIPNADLAIFDQALYNLSKFEAPESTVRMVHNLFKDHQHFSMSILVPLYWLGLDNSAGLILMQAFLLIFFPSVLIPAAYRNFFGTKMPRLGVLALVLFLSLHPFAQYALQSFFHEVYLVPTFASLAIYALSRIHRYGANPLNSVFYAGAILLWLGSKEDQWLYVLFFHLQIVFWYFVLSRFGSIKQVKLKQILVFVGFGLVISLAYMVFLRFYQTLWTYTTYYSAIKDNTVEFLRTFDPRVFLRGTAFLNEMQNHLFRSALALDLPAILLGNTLTAGGYTQRSVSNEYTLGSFIFTQYGALIPFYSVLAYVTVTQLSVLRNQQNVLFVFLIALTTLTVYSGYGTVQGGRIYHQNDYFSFSLSSSLDRFQETESEREAFYEAVDEVPDNGSVRTMFNRTPYISSRDRVSYIEPNECKDPNNDIWWCDRTVRWDQIKYEYEIIPTNPRGTTCFSFPHFPGDCSNQLSYIEQQTEEGSREIYFENEYFTVLRAS